MNKKGLSTTLIVVIAIVVVIAGVVIYYNSKSPQLSPSCIDSDGMNYNIAGNVTVGTLVFKDSCYSTTKVREYYCKTSTTMGVTTSYICPNGCLNGACKNSTTCTPTSCSALGKQCGNITNGTCGAGNCGYCITGQICNATGQCVSSANTTACTDSDGGKNYSVAGLVRYNAYYADYCINNTNLKEYYCPSSTNYSSVTYTCRNCSSNRCV